MDFGLKQRLKASLEGYIQQRASKNLKAEKSYDIISYGTAGFRGNASKIEHLFYNVGLIAGLRCLQLGANIGIMITASHNPVQDNGVKFIDKNGGMLESVWEPIVEKFCNTLESGPLVEQVEHLIKEFSINTSDEMFGQVMIGIDTRPSSEALVELVKQGLEVWSPLVKFIDYGLITTPALHYLVGESNKHESRRIPLQVYYDKLSKGLETIFSQTKLCNFYSPFNLIIDCANGVGRETMAKLCNNELFNKYLPVKLINIGEGILNRGCGADYVKSSHLPPLGSNELGKRYAALDGDADRVIYFFLSTRVDSSDFELNLLDGDKILALYALYLKDMLKNNNLECLSFGVVQTAYANGASTEYLIQNLGLKVDCVSTGVKNLHKQASKYDLAVYFEANGHGTIHVSQEARSKLEESGSNNLTHLLAILNNYTGDAISDILIVETILRHYNWDIKQWFDLYSDQPNSLIKVEVYDRNLIKTIDAERKCSEPEDLQPAIDRIVESFGSGARCFVRPSGTENVVRVYAEARDQVSAEKLAKSVGEVVKHICNRINK